MSTSQNQTEPTQYHIRLQGHLDSGWEDWFGGGTITLLDDGTTLLVCQIVDQAALHGLLRTIRDTGIELLAINRIHQDGV